MGNKKDKARKEKLRRQLADARNLAEQLEVELERITELDRSLRERIQQLSATADAHTAAQLESVRAVTDRVDHARNEGIVTIARAVDTTNAELRATSSRFEARTNSVTTGVEQRGADVLAELENWGRAANQRVTAAAELAIAHVDARTREYDEQLQETTARAADEMRERAHHLLEGAHVWLDDLQQETDRRATAVLPHDREGTPIAWAATDAEPDPRPSSDTQPWAAVEDDATDEPAGWPDDEPERPGSGPSAQASDGVTDVAGNPAIAYGTATTATYVDDFAEPHFADGDHTTGPADDDLADDDAETAFTAETAWSFPPPPEPAAPANGATATSVRISGSAMLASLTQLARSGADTWVRVDLTFDSLRITGLDASGWWEFHDLPVHAYQLHRARATVSGAELLQAIELELRRSPDDLVSLAIDRSIVAGTTLVLEREATIDFPDGSRRTIERVELRNQDGGDLVLDAQLGRFVIPSRLVSVLRSRRAPVVDLVVVGDQPCLSARVTDVARGVRATILAPLHEEDAGATAPEERRDAGRNPVRDLLSSLSSTTSPEELAAIVSSGTGYARRRAAAHPALPAELIDEMLRDGTEAMRAAAASNPSIPPAAVEYAATDSAPVVRAALAGNVGVAPDVLLELAGDPAPQVRVRAAGNSALPEDGLQQLVTDADSGVRSALAQREHLDPALLGELAHDADPTVCAAVAGHRDCPPELFDELVAVAPETVLANPHTPAHLLSAGSLVASTRLRATVAANPSTPASQLEALSRDQQPAVLLAVVDNASASARARRRARRNAGRSRPGADDLVDADDSYAH